MPPLFSIENVNALPSTLAGNTIYNVKDGSDKMFITATNPDGSVAYRTHTNADIMAMLTAGIGGVNQLAVVPNLGGLAALEADGKVKYAVVADAKTGVFNRLDPVTMVPTAVTGDDTIASTTNTSAWYVYSPAHDGWLKTGEGEAVDTTIDFSQITGTQALLAAMDKAHEHANMSVLDDLSDIGGNLAYKGSELQNIKYTNNW